MSRFIPVDPDRVFLVRNPDENAWDMIERVVDLETGLEKETLLARFYSGNNHTPGPLAYWALDEVKFRGRA